MLWSVVSTYYGDSLHCFNMFQRVWCCVKASSTRQSTLGSVYDLMFANVCTNGMQSRLYKTYSTHDFICHKTSEITQLTSYKSCVASRPFTTDVLTHLLRSTIVGQYYWNCMLKLITNSIRELCTSSFISVQKFQERIGKT